MSICVSGSVLLLVAVLGTGAADNTTSATTPGKQFWTDNNLVSKISDLKFRSECFTKSFQTSISFSWLMLWYLLACTTAWSATDFKLCEIKKMFVAFPTLYAGNRSLLHIYFISVWDNCSCDVLTRRKPKTHLELEYFYMCQHRSRSRLRHRR